MQMLLPCFAVFIRVLYRLHRVYHPSADLLGHLDWLEGEAVGQERRSTSRRPQHERPSEPAVIPCQA